MIRAVDTNVLLDILIPNPYHLEWALNSLVSTKTGDQLIISEIVFAELSSQFLSPADLQRFLDETGIQLVSCDVEVLFSAGEAWKRYIGRRRVGVVCSKCGAMQEVVCHSCGTAIRFRQHILSDFLIGAHAKVRADELITRDRGFYRTYFEDLKLITPE
jgi:hypothetical protein